MSNEDTTSTTTVEENVVAKNEEEKVKESEKEDTKQEETTTTPEKEEKEGEEEDKTAEKAAADEEDKDTSVKLFVGQIPKTMMEDDIKPMFTKFGEVNDSSYKTIRANNLSPQKARILLMLSMLQTKNPVKIQQKFDAY